MSKFKHYCVITRGERGELSKIQEELDELKEAHESKSLVWASIEAADILNAVGLFISKHYSIWFMGIILLAIARAIYKPLQRILRERYRRSEIGEVE